VFPFPHRVEMTASLVSDGLTVETILTAGSEGPVPVSPTADSPWFWIVSQPLLGVTDWFFRVRGWQVALMWL